MQLGPKCLFIVGGGFFCMIQSFVGFSCTALIAVTCVLFVAAVAHFGGGRQNLFYFQKNVACDQGRSS